MKPADASVVGDALNVVIVARRAGNAELADPILGQNTHAVQLSALGQHGEEPRGAAGVWGEVGLGDAGSARTVAAEGIRDEGEGE